MLPTSVLALAPMNAVLLCGLRLLRAATLSSPMLQFPIAWTVALLMPLARRRGLASTLMLPASACGNSPCQLTPNAADATPSKTLDKHLTNAEFDLEVALRLGVDVFEGGLPCPFCGIQLDTCGRHALSCMSGGDTVLLHNSIRDLVYIRL